MNTNVDHPESTAPVRTPEEHERILKAAREAKVTIIAVAALTIGSMIFMVLIVLVMIGLKVL